MTDARKVLQHYGPNDLVTRLQAALTAAGLGEGSLSARDLAPLDQFHSRGLAATEELAAAAEVVAGSLVIDIGSGLGGPSRYLAATFGCRVQGVDISPAFVEAASFLAERAGLTDKVTYQCGDALALPFPDGHFDLAWTQHVAMNIADRSRLYSEAFRVLRPGGCLAIYDVVAGTGGPLEFPVPWSRGPETSFLLTAPAMRAALERQGFVVVGWTDHTDLAIDWFTNRARPAGPLGLQIAMGPDFPAMGANLGRNLREGRAAIIQAILSRP